MIKFVGFALYCRLPFSNDRQFESHCKRPFPFSLGWGATVKTKLVKKYAAMDQPTLEKLFYLEVSNAVASGSHDCFVYVPFYEPKIDFRGKGKGAIWVNDPNDFCKFEASLDCEVSTNWGVRLVYVDNIEEMRLKFTMQFKRDEPGYDKEKFELFKERRKELSVPEEIQFFLHRLGFDDLSVLPTCPRCFSHSEDFSHVFLNCKYSQLVWRGSRVGLNFEVGTPIQVQDWFLTWNLSAPQDEDLSFSYAILWAIWTHRNKVVHEGVPFVPSKVISTAIEEHSRFPNSISREIEALEKAPLEMAMDLKALCHYFDIHQDDDILVMEVKGAWKEGQKFAGVAWIAYDKQGFKVAAATKSLKVISRLHAEVHAFEYALKWASTEVSTIIILSDNQTLIKQLNSSNWFPDRDINYMLQRCMEMMEIEEVLWKAVKVPSYIVSGARRAAKMAMTSYTDVLNSALILPSSS